MLKSRFLAAVAAIALLSSSAALAQNIPYSPGSVTPNPPHEAINNNTTAVPALSSCGTSPSFVGNDNAGVITLGTGTPTGCVVTFGVPYVSAPMCSVVWETGPIAAMSWTVTNLALTITQTGTNSTKVAYLCIAQAGG